jgi:hypothetical protein
MLEGEGSDTMRFTRLEREKITDGFLSIQSAESSLRDVDESKVPELDGIHDCLKAADRTLRRILRYSPTRKK